MRNGKLLLFFLVLHIQLCFCLPISHKKQLTVPLLPHRSAPSGMTHSKIPYIFSLSHTPQTGLNSETNPHLKPCLINWAPIRLSKNFSMLFWQIIMVVKSLIGWVRSLQIRYGGREKRVTLKLFGVENKRKSFLSIRRIHGNLVRDSLANTWQANFLGVF